MARCLALVAIIIWFTLFSPYLTTAFIASVTAALTLPLYRWLRARMSKSASVIFFSVGMVVCVATPITIVLVTHSAEVGAFAKEAYHIKDGLIVGGTYTEK